MVVHIEGRGADALVQPARCGCSHEDASTSSLPHTRSMSPALARTGPSMQGGTTTRSMASGMTELVQSAPGLPAHRVAVGMRGSMTRSHSHSILNSNPEIRAQTRHSAMYDPEVRKLSSQAAVSAWVRHRVLHGSHNFALWDQSRRMPVQQQQQPTVDLRPSAVPARGVVVRAA